MNTSDRIAAAIKSILDEDRRADRERIAELERDLSHMQLRVDLALSEDNEIHKQLDELTEKCAALVLEKEIARGDLVKLREERDRERIAELERDFARALVREREANERTGAAIHRVQSLENGAEWERKDVNATIAALNKQLDELTEKCAALVVERYEIARDHRHMREQMTAQMAAIERDISPTLDDAIVQFATRK